MNLARGTKIVDPEGRIGFVTGHDTLTQRVAIRWIPSSVKLHGAPQRANCHFNKNSGNYVEYVFLDTAKAWSQA